VKDDELVKAAKAMAELKQALPAILDLQSPFCQIAWRRYCNLQREGFSSADAVRIVADNFTKMS
jgi:hypothetical protein